jgi:glycosyltransferase involved in cell wall biosynthesis
VIFGKKIVVVLPAYNAEKTLRRTWEELPKEFIDDVLVVDDCSSDATVKVAEELHLRCFRHNKNFGYGRNQKTCYREALSAGADVVVMVHPDYQYDPKLALALASMVACGTYEAAIASRILGKGALKGGMPRYKYFFNRVLTLAQNVLMNSKLSEFHTGYRAFSRKVLEALPLEENADGFVFDNEMLAQIVWFGFPLGEISCPTLYFAEASSIRFGPSVRYGFGVLRTSLKYRLQRLGLAKYRIFNPDGRRLREDYYAEMPAAALEGRTPGRE